MNSSTPEQQVAFDYELEQLYKLDPEEYIIGEKKDDGYIDWNIFDSKWLKILDDWNLYVNPSLHIVTSWDKDWKMIYDTARESTKIEGDPK